MKKAYGLRIFRATGIALHQPRDSSTMPRLIAFILAVAIAISVQATPTTPALNSRATDFAVEVAARDFRSARKGNQHVFSYTENETEEALSRSLREWLTRGETRNMRMALTDRLTLFAFYWAALQMPADSLCFSDIDSQDCADELGYWLAQVRGGSPEFIAAYRAAELRLKLPPLAIKK
ncbi:hypothetical protein AWB68_08368 [Caballeronia choica]|uniref:Uncharacterized protein n=1 Tax=Caballeronia choica TaxID=326476 RepID=A0A158L3B2_9BURK|nr:hypothetical protein [Caballeronia choica]SAL87340.1 hypothetical protein AWB68_08368 [Caballeronia choica]